jgi:DNA invertase Pin-like site-specific DNA recombinase
MSRKKTTPAIAYLRTSSSTNVGVDKDSEKRQRIAIGAYAKRAGYGLVAEFYDAAVSGADPIQDRPGFAALLDRIEANGVRTVLVEDASRFARELMAQELGITLLISRGVDLITASGDDLTASDDPSRKMMRQIAGAFADTRAHAAESTSADDHTRLAEIAGALRALKNSRDRLLVL